MLYGTLKIYKMKILLHEISQITVFRCVNLFFQSFFSLPLFTCSCDDYSDSSEDDLTDDFVKKLLIITQSSRHDRTGNHTPRSKLTAEISQAISDGLYFYEQVQVHVDSVLREVR